MKLTAIKLLHRQQLALATALLSCAASATPAEGGTPASLKDAITQGALNFDFRYRVEHVNDARPEHAAASTLRSRISYTSRAHNTFQMALEVDNVTLLGQENYDDLHGSATDHSVVADPKGTEINQAWLAFTGIPKTTLKYGRQRINLDNQRFIGGVGWRQNEQTYDALSLVNTAITETTITYAYVDNVNRIFGPDAGRTGTPAADVDLNSSAHVLNAGYKGFAAGMLSAYAYLLDIEDAPALSSKTYGLRFSGTRGETPKVLYTLEYARQLDYGDNPVSYSANYYTLEGELQGKSMGGKLGYEVLGADDNANIAFATPLATLHKFQGFADLFLNTPSNGVEDIYAGLSGKLLGTNISLTYHNFSANKGGHDYGSEVDLAIAKQVNENLHLLVKYADYNAVQFGADTKKAWLQLTLTF